MGQFKICDPTKSLGLNNETMKNSEVHQNVTSVLCGEISWQFYGKKEVSIETIFNFIFYCATVSRENCVKLAALFSDYFWHQK